jgi:hypothetical protein
MDSSFLTKAFTLRLVICGFALIGSAWADSRDLMDGHAWLALSAGQRDGWIAGYFDCYVFDTKRTRYPGGSMNQWITYVSRYYERNQENLRTPLATVFENIDTGRPQESRAHLERHTYFDGDFWRILSDSERGAFLAGYLECAKLADKSHPPRAISYYVSAISTWYGVKEGDVAEINARRANTKIADVLRRLRNADRPAYQP